MEANAQLLREELRSLKVNDETLTALKSQVEELRHRGEHGLMENLSSELGSHTQSLKEAILSGQGGSGTARLAKAIARATKASTADLELIIARTPKRGHFFAHRGETSALKEDITRMRDSFARDAAADEVRALNQTGDAPATAVVRGGFEAAAARGATCESGLVPRGAEHPAGSVEGRSQAPAVGAGGTSPSEAEPTSTPHVYGRSSSMRCSERRTTRLRN